MQASSQMPRLNKQFLSGRALFLDTGTLDGAHHASLHDEDKEHGHAKDDPPSAQHSDTGQADQVAQLNANADEDFLHAASAADASVKEPTSAGQITDRQVTRFS